MMYSQIMKLSIFVSAIVLQCTGPANRKPVTQKDSSLHNNQSVSDQREAMEQTQKTLVIQGIFDSAGVELIKIERPTLYNRHLAHPTPNLRTGRYFVLIQYNESDSLKTYFDGLVAGDRDIKSQHGFFEVQIPVKDQAIQSLKIIEVATRKVLITFRQKDIILK